MAETTGNRKKRGQNEGSVVQRKDGRWMARITIPAAESSTGKAERKTFYGKTAAEARKKLREAERQMHSNLPITTDKLRVDAFLRQWLEESVKPSVRPRTYDSYAMHVERHLIPALGQFPLARLGAEQVQRMMNRQLESGLSPRSVQYSRAVLRRALGQALKWGLVSRNVATLVEPPKSRHQERVFLTPEQGRAFLTAVKGDRLEALFTVALAVGLRQGEALGLSWDDVDFVASTITVRHQLQRLKGTDGKSSLVLTEPKSASSRRTIPMPDIVSRALLAHRDRQAVEEAALADTWVNWGGDGGLVFTTGHGTPIEVQTLIRRFKTVLREAGLPEKLRWHDLRHSCASLMLAEGVNPHVVKEVLGHSQISLTMNTYAHAFEDSKRAAAASMSRMLEAVEHG